MAEEIVIIYPPESLNIFSTKTNIKNEVILYNKTCKNILYKIRTNDNNIIKIENPLSILNPYNSQNIKFYFIKKNNLIKENNYKLILYFYKLENNNFKNVKDLNKILNENNVKENQKSILNIFITNNSLKEIKKDEEYKKDIQKYLKFKNDLNYINEEIKKLIDSNNIINGIKYKIFIYILIFILLFGFIFGLILSKKYIKFLDAKINKTKIIQEEEDNDDFFYEKFMSIKELDEIKEIESQNLIKFQTLNNINILKEVKKKIEKIDFQNLEKIKKNELKDYGHYIILNYIFYLILLFIIV